MPAPHPCSLPAPQQPAYGLGHQGVYLYTSLCKGALAVPHILLEVMLQIQAEHKNTHLPLILQAVGLACRSRARHPEGDRKMKERRFIET